MTAIFDFLPVWDPITTLGILTRETAAHRCHIHSLTKHILSQTNGGEPFEQGLASRPGKRSMQLDFPVARGLANQYYWRYDRLSGHGWAVHQWTKMAAVQSGLQVVEYLGRSLHGDLDSEIGTAI